MPMWSDTTNESKDNFAELELDDKLFLRVERHSRRTTEWDIGLWKRMGEGNFEIKRFKLENTQLIEIAQWEGRKLVRQWLIQLLGRL